MREIKTSVIFCERILEFLLPPVTLVIFPLPRVQNLNNTNSGNFISHSMLFFKRSNQTMYNVTMESYIFRGKPGHRRSFYARDLCQKKENQSP